jgi:aminopeptidase N
MRRTQRLVALGVVLAFAAIAPGTASAWHWPGWAGPGSPGLGDPYFPLAGNGGIDVRHYSLKLAYDPDTDVLDGKAVLLVRATKSLTRFDLDLRGFALSRVAVNGRSARYARYGQELVIKPKWPLRRGRWFTVEVSYRGVPEVVTDPDESIEGWVPTDDGAFVVGEPQGSPSWYPANDHPTDKATYDFKVTVPEGLTAVANGALLGQETRSGKTTFRWRERYPMAPHLATATIGEFDVETGETPSGIPVYLAVDPTQSDAWTVLEELPDAVEFYASVYGRYPFETVGAIVDHAPDVGYALETQTKPVFDSAPDEATLVHELAHMWFGDSVTLERWKDIWLHEGFATWSEWLWSEHVGRETAAENFDELYATPASDEDFWNPPPGDPGGPENLFDGTIYDRGAMTLQALREKIGDRAFFKTLRAWAFFHAYGHGTTREFVRLAEHVSHRRLDRFFRVWLYTPGKPTSW